MMWWWWWRNQKFDKPESSEAQQTREKEFAVRRDVGLTS